MGEGGRRECGDAGDREYEVVHASWVVQREAEQCRSGGHDHAVWTTGEREVVRGDSHDLAEAEGDDGQVVAAQPECGVADEVTPDRGDEHGDGKGEPPVP